MSPSAIILIIFLIFMLYILPADGKQLSVTKYNDSGAPTIILNEPYSAVQKVGDNYYFVLRDEVAMCQPPVKCRNLPAGRAYYDIKKGEVYAFKFTYLDNLHIIWYDAASGYELSTKRAAISSKPGDFSHSLSVYCRRESFTGTIYYGTRFCELAPGKAYYFNILDVNCPAGKNCRFVLEAN